MTAARRSDATGQCCLALYESFFCNLIALRVDTDPYRILCRLRRGEVFAYLAQDDGWRDPNCWSIVIMVFFRLVVSGPSSWISQRTA